ncbi:DUF1488 domain-containing protein [Paraburkholderia sp. BL10I2N1]|uniref:DUF1488 domain-containing protein n=1 Tax=Paraburkholderia sp. BL10I2N1 TaxID=1938796 RepID=UPI00106070FE|nr:DUF1488 domain-containing protein [Paraburkholderia sp. BL10I2N1]TDN69880.1 uncharacterized protein DUF1488 [Paraburkholderia sp. BL10I2N1]
MSLNFPNPSRSYDASRHCVVFWGYDDSREIAFQVDEAVLSNLSPGMASDESSMLAAFDLHHDRVLLLARGVYSGGPQKNRYTIS